MSCSKPTKDIPSATHKTTLNDVTQTLIKKLETAADTGLEQVTVSLFGIPLARLRSKFFHELASNLPGYSRSDVTAVYVYKAKPDACVKDDEDEDADDDGIESATHVERVSLRGNGVTRSEILNNLLEKDDYFITKIAWGAREIAGSGHDYDIEAMFANPRDCIEFSFILVFTDLKMDSYVPVGELRLSMRLKLSRCC